MTTRLFVRRSAGVVEILLSEEIADRLERASHGAQYPTELLLHAVLHHGLTVFEHERRNAAANTNETIRN